eukprot:6492788-Prorocentrum_lima.AAC.1
MPPTRVPSFTVLVGNDVRTSPGKSARGAPRRSYSEAWAVRVVEARLRNDFRVCNQFASNVSG